MIKVLRATNMLTLRLDDEILSELDALRKSEGQTRSRMLRLLIRRAFERMELPKRA